MPFSPRSWSFVFGTTAVVMLWLLGPLPAHTQNSGVPKLTWSMGNTVRWQGTENTTFNSGNTPSADVTGDRSSSSNNTGGSTTGPEEDSSENGLSPRNTPASPPPTEGETCENRVGCSGRGPLQKGPTLKLAYLTTCQEDQTKKFLGLKISGAFALAVEEVNRNQILPQGYKFEYEVHNTHSDLLRSVGQVCNGTQSGVSAFIGPSESCEIETVVAAAANRPVLSYACAELNPHNYGNFVRFNPMEKTVLNKLIELFISRKWKKFRVLYSEPHHTLAQRLEDQATRNNLTHLGTIRVNKLEDIIAAFEDTQDQTRIYVALCPKQMVSKLLLGMVLSGLLDHDPPLYLLVFLDVQPSHESDWARTVWSNYRYGLSTATRQFLLSKYSKSLLVVRGTYPKRDFVAWRNRVVERNQRPPFCFTQRYGDVQVPYLQTAYLYDSVIQYAEAIKRAYLQRIDSGEKVSVDEVARNGSLIVAQLRGHNYTSTVLDHIQKLDTNAENEGTYSGYLFYSCPDCGKPKLPRDPELRRLDPGLPPPNSTVALSRRRGGRQRRAATGSSFWQRICSAAFWNETDDVPWNGTEVEEVACFVEVIYYVEQEAKTRYSGWNIRDEPECGFEGCQPRSHLRKGLCWAFFCFFLLQWLYGVLHYIIYRAEITITGLEWKIAQSEIECISNARPRGSTRSLAMTSNSAGLLFYSPAGIYQGIVVCLKPAHFSNTRQGFSRTLKKEICLIRKMSHQNLCRFYGICVDDGSPILVSEYRERGSLQDVLRNELAFLDEAFLDSLLYDLVRGMTYLHDMYGPHGRLTASNCVVTGRWVLQVADYGLNVLQPPAQSQDSFKRLYKSLYRAPELLRKAETTEATKEGDVYSFGIILHEALGGEGPFSLQDTLLEAHYESALNAVLDGVKRGPTVGEPMVRPNVTSLVEKPFGTNKDVLNLMKKCWAEDPAERPFFKDIKTDFHKITKQQRKGNLMDHLVSMMEKHSNNLEKLIEARTKELMDEKKLTEQLLYSMLPRTVAESLKHGIAVEPQSFDSVTIYFSDIVGFTALSSESTPMQIVTFLDDLYRMFDGIISGYDVYKVETIGDAYMVVSGLPVKNELRHAGEIASMALELLDKTQNDFKITHRPDQSLNLRVGLHTGPVMAGVVGLSMPRYCLFGDTVNTAARMESNGAPNKIHISSACREALEALDGYIMETRGLVEMKGKGQLVTHWLLSATPKAIKRRQSRKTSMAPMFQRPGEYHRMSQSSNRLSYGDDQLKCLPRYGSNAFVDRQRIVDSRRRCSSISNMPSEVVRRSYHRRLGTGTLPPASSVDTLPPHLRSRGTGLDAKGFSPLVRCSPVPVPPGMRRSHPPSPLVESVL